MGRKLSVLRFGTGEDVISVAGTAAIGRLMAIGTGRQLRFLNGGAVAHEVEVVICINALVVAILAVLLGVATSAISKAWSVRC